MNGSNGAREDEMDIDERERAADLLAAHHSFPGPFGLRVMVQPHARDHVLVKLGEVVDVVVVSVSERVSSKGAWVSLAVTVHAESAYAVLDAYAAVNGLPGVGMTL
jgi:putative lipoic acid-binding regulatory protein